MAANDYYDWRDTNLEKEKREMTMPITLIQKIKSLKRIISVGYYKDLMKKNCIKCGDNIRIFFPYSIKGAQYMEIGDNFKLDYGGTLEAWDCHNGVEFQPHIRIGNNVSFGKNCHIGCINGITIGDNVLVGSDVLIIDHNHGSCTQNDRDVPPNSRVLSSSGEIVIEENVWIGEKVTVLAGVHIGKNCIIGANTVVVKDIPSYCVAVGNPARVIKTI